MRLVFNLKLQGEGPWKIPVDYNKKITNIIKQQLPKKMVKEFYNKKENKMKPFTFALYIPNVRKEGDTHITDNPNLRLTISTNDESWFYAFFCVEFKYLFGYKILTYKSAPKFNPLFKKTSVIFKTLSPLLVAKIEKNKGKGYLDFEDPRFLTQLKFNILNKFKYFTDKDYSKDLDLEILVGKTLYLKNYGGEIGFNGVLKITATKNLLKLLYDIGLGSKCSQGYGLVEVIC